MRLVIIKPSLYEARAKGAMQPLFAAAIAYHTPEDVDIQFFDDRIEDIPAELDADLVAISIETFNAKRSYEIIRKCHRSGARVIAGGYHASILPDECLEHADAVFIGDLEVNWIDVIDDFKNGMLKQIYRGQQGTSAQIGFDRSIFKGKSYGPVELVLWGRGCKFNCDFCSIKTFYPSSVQCRAIPHMIAELERLEKRTVFFVDDNLFNDRERLREFLIAITPLRLKWTCQISIDVARDEAILKLMKESGCFMVLIGIESFEIDNLKQMKKSWNMASIGVEESIRRVTDNGILVYGTFVFGYDYDTPQSFEKAVQFAIKNKFFIANFNPLYPMPGTRLISRLRTEGRLLFDKWWLDPDFYYGKSMFRPKSMSPEELEKMCFDAKMEFNSWRSIIRRGLNYNVTSSLRNTLLYLYANTTNRKEIFNKQGKKLGNPIPS